MDKGALVVVLILAFCSPLRAQMTDYETVAVYAGVPAKMLYAIAMTESGMYHQGESAPWPWTLNVEGNAARYRDRQAMFEGLMSALQSGQTRVDVGPMQVNWYWQFDRISSPWTITDPVVNLKVGAAILKRHFLESGDWWEAIGRYHRPAQTAEHHSAALRYLEKVRVALHDAFPDPAVTDA